MHTKEPWKLNNYGTVLAEGHTLLVTGMALNTGRSDPLAEANSRRIVACVNACAGVPIEVLEMTGATMVPPEEPYSIVKQQRDELLAALKEIASIENEMYGSDWDEIEKARSIANAAIAKADLTQ